MGDNCETDDTRAKILFGFNITPKLSDTGRTTYRLSVDFPKNFSIRQNCSSRLGMGTELETCDGEYVLSLRASYDIYMNDKLTYRLVPTVYFVMNDYTHRYAHVDDFFTYEQIDNLTICLTPTLKFDNLVLILVEDGIETECHRYDNKYYLYIENQQYYAKDLENPEHRYEIFQRATFEVKRV